MIDLVQNIALTVMCLVLMYYMWQFDNRKKDIKLLYENDKKLADFSNELSEDIESIKTHQEVIIDKAWDVIADEMKGNKDGR